MLASLLHEASMRTGIHLHRIVTVDFETNIKNTTIGTNKASPFCPQNNIVMAGVQSVYPSGTESFGYSSDVKLRNAIIVGHNVKFDALYMMKHYQDLLKENLLWDTMEVEYILSGQQEKMASLDKLSVKYGLPVKDDKIKEYWNNGVDTEDIPKEELLSYLTQDVYNTSSIFRQQLAKINHMAGMSSLVIDSMLALNMTTQMEYNGLYVDMNKLIELASEVHNNLSKVEKELEELCSIEFNSVDYNSNKELSCLLWGGEVTRENTVEVLDKDGLLYIYKSGKKKGKVKTKKVKAKVRVEGILPITIIDSSKYKGSVDEEALSSIRTELTPGNPVSNLINLLLQQRELYKDFHTYYAGVGKLVWPHDSCVHGQLLHTVTSTGRLSSREPNMQNFPSYTEAD